MFSTIRKRFTYTNVAVTVALVFAMSGGAYAASKYVITSTKQISPKVLKTLQGKAGKAGANGAQGAPGVAGAQGSAGPQGPQGPAGAAGPNGTNGENGKEGEKGKEGSPWTAGGTLPSEKSEQGVWSVLYTATAAGQAGSADISFNIPLAEAPEATKTTNFIGLKEGENEENENKTAIPSHCKGTVSNPIAQPGNLCVFARSLGNATLGGAFLSQLFLNPQEGTFEAAGTNGTVMDFAATAEGTVFADGDWAVTAK